MFGGILRAIFGIYSPTKYWDTELEKDVEEGIRQYYGKSKASEDYGIYSYKCLKAFTLCGMAWHHGQPAKPFKQRKKNILVKKNNIMEIRINKLDTVKPRVDIELCLGNFREGETRTYTVDWELFQWWIKQRRIKRIQEGKIYELKSYWTSRPTPQ